MPSNAEPRQADRTTSDVAVAIKSAVVLGVSLVATWSIALVVRLYLPRYLGPEAFGVLSFADKFAAMSFIVLGLGVEFYILKTIPVRPRHASDFFGGIVALRLLISAGVFGAMALILTVMGRDPEVKRVVFIFGIANVLVSLNGSLAALLYASRAVSGVAVVNVASKLLWGAGIALAIAGRLGLAGLALALLLSESLRLLALARLARRHLGLHLRFDAAAVKVVILAGIPIYLNQIATTIYGQVDVSMLSVLSNDAEVGYYSTAAILAALALLISPLIGRVLLPLLSRAAARSQAEMFSILRRAIEVILLLVIPFALFMGLGADIWVPALFGQAYVPAIPSLRILAPVFVFTYLGSVGGSCLLLLDRAWRLATISLVGLVVNPVLNLLLVPWAMRSFGVGGAGVGAATALLLTEASVTLAVLRACGPDAVDRAGVVSVGKALLCCGAVVAADLAIRPLGPARIAVDAALYVLLMFALGAVKVADLRGLVQFLRARPWRSGRS